jgi:hypothetical protein
VGRASNLCFRKTSNGFQLEWNECSVYRNSAKVAKDDGFDGVQTQAGFVYRIQRFLHETTKRRTDEYGGGIENRARCLFEVGKRSSTPRPPCCDVLLSYHLTIFL